MLMSAVSSSPTWRNVLVTVAAAGACGLVLLAAPSDAQTVPSAGAQASVSGLGAAVEDTALRPFHIDVPEEALVDLRRRIAATRSPNRETVDDFSQGVQLTKIQELVRYWGTDYPYNVIFALTSFLESPILPQEFLAIHGEAADVTGLSDSRARGYASPICACTQRCRRPLARIARLS
jgi:hypothetical protein